MTTGRPEPRSQGGWRTAVLVLGLALGGALGAAAQVPVRADPADRNGILDDTTYVDAVIRLDIDGGPSEIVPALTYNTTLLLPLRQFLQMAGIRLAAFAAGDSLVAIFEPGAVPIRLNPGARSVTRGAEVVPYDTLHMVWWEGDLFVATRLLDRLIGVRTSVEWVGLSAMVGNSRGLPVVQRARRERRRNLLDARRPSPDVLDLALQQRTVDGAVASWSFTSARRAGSEQTSLDLGFGAGLLGGSAELRPILRTSQDASDAELRWSWARAWEDSRTIRQVRLGHVQSGGRRARLMTGAFITNAPFIRSSEFDVEQFVTDVPAGWEAELYEGGRLLAYADADAVGAFRTPLQLGYGQNPFELVLYGPGGETVRRNRTIRVPFSRIPRGRLEYTLSAGSCRYDPCDGLVSADARYGISTQVTVQGGWDAFFGASRPALWQPYVIVSGAPLPALGLTGEAVGNGHVRAAANYEPSMDLRLTGGYTSFAESGSQLSGTLAEASRAEASAFWRPGWMRGELFLQGAGVYSSGPVMKRSLTRLAASTRFGLVRYSFGVLKDDLSRTGAADTDRFAFDAGADLVLSGPWRWLRSAAVQGQLAFEPAHGLTAVRTLIGRRVGTSIRLDGGMGWQRGSGFTLELAFASSTRGPRYGARSRVAGSGGAEALVYSSGSAAWDPRTRLFQLSDVSDLGRAGISGVLFQDDNSNGVQDPGEAGLPGIPLHVGGLAAQTDERGRFSAWGMFPSVALQIEVDTLSFENPQLVLPASVLRVVPAPNSFGAVAVPVVVGGEVSGYVSLGNQALSGIPVVMREMNTGAEITTTTFGDGGFYRGAVPPGEYEIIIPDAVLEHLQATAPPLHIFVPPGGGEKRFADLELRLERRQ